MGNNCNCLSSKDASFLNLTMSNQANAPSKLLFSFVFY